MRNARSKPGVVTAVVRADDTVEDHVKVSDHIGDDAYLVQGGAMIQHRDSA
jgi:hypothetical protein